MQNLIAIIVQNELCHLRSPLLIWLRH